MTTPAPSGPSRRRVAGLALVGVGVIAAIIGVASLALNNGGGAPTAAPPPASETAAPAPGTPGAPGGTPGEPVPTSAPPASGQPDPNQVTVPTFPSTPTNGVAAPGQPAPGQPGAQPGGADASGAGSGASGSGESGGGAGGGSGAGDAAVTAAPVRVYNNSNISDLAADAAADFRNAGFTVDEVGNYPFGQVSESTVYYRPGTGEQATAEALGERFGIRVHERFPELEKASPGVIVLVARDYANA